MCVREMIKKITDSAKSGKLRILDFLTSGVKRTLHSSVKIVDQGISFFQNKKTNELKELTKNARLVGTVVLIGFFGIFGMWAVFAPIDGASLAMGEIVISSDKKSVQHLEGGIIEEIFVHEGDHVTEGQVLMTLKNVGNKAQLSILEENQISLLATEQRLLAHIGRKPNMELPNMEKLEYVTEEKKNDTIKNQLLLFESNKESFANKVRIIDKKIGQIQNEVLALKAQLESAEKSVQLLEEELEAKRSLYDEHVIDKTKIVSLERERISWNGKIAEYKALIARGEQRVTEAELEKIQAENSFNSELAAQLKEVSHAIHENMQKLTTAYDLMLRTIIRAPQAGIVTGLRSLSIGGVIPPAISLMEIVPENEDMFIEAKVAPNNIEAIASARLVKKNLSEVDGYIGVKTRVKITAFNSKKVGILKGVMTYISANTILDPRTGMHYYLAHIRIPKSEIAMINARTKLYPGMPAVVFITTESRSFLSYLLAPIIATFDTAFRER
ncbi:secretion protein, HlyD family [Neorickettsia risticii str. Illinois]|uniref:Membrane fusion protein (MFP) family protein n=2 Tax=Neorickettsia risticii TaxID=950 RepID=C6V647_NEORI|nr:secretion protein, HlyD family [Neorickettsia risticii str. Illinois]